MHTNLDENMLRARTRDLAEQCDRKNRTVTTGFLTPAEMTVVNAAAGRSGVSFKISGGYEAAERRILLFQPDYLDGAEPDWDDYLKVLRITSARDGLDHRDYLGAILALGMRRDQIGDILVEEKSARVILLPAISEYLLLNMEKAGSARVTVKSETLAELTVPDAQLITVSGNVSSLRLDNIAAEGFNMQRSEIAERIRSGQVSLNFVPETRPDHVLKPGDMISLRGYGRVNFVSIDGRSRKDRFFITLEKTK